MGLIDIREPLWFYKADVFIQFFGALVALLISYYGYKGYKITSKKSYLYFSIAFFLFSLSLLIYSVVLPFVAIYYIGSGFITNIISIENLVLGSRILNFIYMVSYLLAYILLVAVYSKSEKKSAIAGGAIIALLISAVFSVTYKTFTQQTFLAFNVISLLLLLTIIYYTYKSYTARKNKNTLSVLAAFILLAASHFLLLFDSLSNAFFLSAHIAQLIGYLSLLTVYYKARIYK